MVALTDEQRRALQLLAGSPNGCTEAILMAHGFHLAMLGKLAFDGFANVEARETMAGSRRMKVFWLRITEAGRKAIAEWKRPRAEARGQVRGLPKHSIRQGPI
jgi:DNA-binding PadR family transcriptional regulator